MIKIWFVKIKLNLITFTQSIGVSVESRWAVALVSTRQIFANGVETADGLSSLLQALVDVLALA